jgi:hypothetical protein
MAAEYRTLSERIIRLDERIRKAQQDPHTDVPVKRRLVMEQQLSSMLEYLDHLRTQLAMDSHNVHGDNPA